MHEPTDFAAKHDSGRRPTYIKAMRKPVAIGIGAVTALVLIAIVVVFATGDDEQAAPGEMGGPAARPAVWNVDDQSRPGLVRAGDVALEVGAVSLAAPQPIGASIAWKADETPGGFALLGEGKVVGADAEFGWRAGSGNPHTIFEGNFTAPAGLLAKPVSGSIELPAGDVTYINAGMEPVPFAGQPVVLSALSSGAIRWRNGADVVTLWQWRADRVELAEVDGRVRVTFHWFHPDHHALPDDCVEELADLQVSVRPRVVVSFADVAISSLGRFPAGVTSAVVPVFFDPVDAENSDVRDGGSTSESDYAARATTIAMGHSAKNDARYGNGGLVGLEVGGTIVIPSRFDTDNEPLFAFEEAVEPTSVDTIREDRARPETCSDWKEMLQASEPILAEPVIFDGTFPNLLGPEQRPHAPGVTSLASTWRPTRLTGRRKDVVTQALSRTYLERLAERRGLALLEIPLVATRNPLVAAAGETLLEPESNGHWTIQEDVARALGEVELLSEESRFDFLSLRQADTYWRATQSVEIDEGNDGVYRVHNRGDGAIQGFTLVADGLVTAMVDGARIEQEVRRGEGDAEQTWFWWDLPASGVSELRVERPNAALAVPVGWSLPE